MESSKDKVNNQAIMQHLHQSKLSSADNVKALTDLVLAGKLDPKASANPVIGGYQG